MAKAPRSLAGKVVAITGGARGIGRATAAALIAQGARVAIGDIDAPLAGQAAAELGSGTLGLPLDVTDRASFDAFLTEVENRLGPLDVVINNAGIMPIGPFVDETDATAQRLVDINLHGVILGSKLALARFMLRGRGHLVNIASVAGKGGFPGGATYCATKHAVVGLSEAIRGELKALGHDGISVSCVMPNIVGTELGTGIEATRFSPMLTPEQVAEETLLALKEDRFEVYVPRSAKGVMYVSSLLPRRGREAMARAAKVDRMMLDANMEARKGYELRAAHSEPGLEPGASPEQLTERAGSS